MMQEPELRGKDIISVRDFAREDLERIFDATELIERSPEKFADSAKGQLVALLFFEPSTRTFSSFQIAAQRLGCSTSGFATPAESSVTKGETLHDTLRMFEGYGTSCFVIRHPMMGAARFAAESTHLPVISGGDGSREHPTQAMLDMYTIRKSFKRIDGLKIGILGDLKYGRTASSLSYGISNYEVELSFIAPEALQIRPEVEVYLRGKGVKTRRESNLREAITSLDVLYVTRIQKERIPDPTEYERLRGLYQVNLETLKDAKSSLKVMHPLPRVDEIATEVDSSEFAHYFVQAAGGVPLRMALLRMILGGA